MKLFVLPILFAAALPAADSRIMPAMNAFTTAAYKQLAEGNGNLILSPFNISIALSMALAGARGRTADEIQSVLHVHYDATYDAALGTLVADLTKGANTGGNELHTANGIWVQKGFAIQPAYVSTVTTDYRAPLTPLDFITNPEGARTQINEWIAERTKDKIQNLLPANSIKPDTRLVIGSAIYFYGKWQDRFLTLLTRPAPFTLPTGSTTQANFMNQTSQFDYAEAGPVQILEMRYAGTGMAFDVSSRRARRDFPRSRNHLPPMA